MDYVDQLQDIRDALDKKHRAYNRSEGELTALRKLLTELGLKDVEEAKVEINKLKVKLKRLNTKVRNQFKAWENDYLD